MVDKKTWSKDETYVLITRWESMPELWDCKSKEYRNKIKKQNAIKCLATEFKTQENEITRKLHNLRTQFHQELRKIEIKHSGDGVEDVRQTNWEFFQAMLFIRAKHSNPRTTDNLMEESDNAGPSSASSTNVVTDNTSNNATGTTDIDPAPTTNVAKKRKKKDSKQVNEDILLEKAMTVLDKPADDFQIFGDFVASELRNLQSKDKQNLLKRIIQRAILQISESNTPQTSHSAQPSASSSPWTIRSESVSSYYSNYTPMGSNECNRVSQIEPYSILGLSGQAYTQEYETSTSENDTNLL